MLAEFEVEEFEIAELGMVSDVEATVLARAPCCSMVYNAYARMSQKRGFKSLGSERQG